MSAWRRTLTTYRVSGVPSGDLTSTVIGLSAGLTFRGMGGDATFETVATPWIQSTSDGFESVAVTRIDVTGYSTSAEYAVVA